MKLVNQDIIANSSLDIELPFDAGLITNVSKTDEAGIYMLTYEAQVRAGAIFVQAIDIVARLTQDNIYVNAIAYVDPELADAGGINCDGVLEFSVEADEKEKLKILLAIVRFAS